MICSSSILIFDIQVNIPALTMSICRIIHTELLHTVLFRFAITHGAFSLFTTRGAFLFNEIAPWQCRFLPGNRLRPFTTHGARGASRCLRCFFGTPRNWSAFTITTWFQRWCISILMLFLNSQTSICIIEF